jgi:hypothetical protein
MQNWIHKYITKSLGTCDKIVVDETGAVIHFINSKQSTVHTLFFIYVKRKSTKNEVFFYKK